VKYWGDEFMGLTSNFGGTVPPFPPKSPPMHVGIWALYSSAF